MLASREPELFNGNMENQSRSASRARNGGAPQPGTADWRPAQGIIDRMLAYRDWWNIPEGRGRPGPARNRARPQSPSEREAAS
jgi:hypothetical protein